MEAPDYTKGGQEVRTAFANNEPHKNKSASFSTQGEVRLDGEFFQAQGTNGRNCASCHVPEDAWSITPATAQRFFNESGGTHPLFSRLDADKPSYTDAQIAAMTVAQKRAVFSMLLEGKFTRSVNAPATRDYDITAVSDPFGVGTLTRFWFFRRPLATANFRSHSVMWDHANTVGTDLRAGLVRQARGNVTGAQAGPPATDDVINEIVDYEMDMSNAQLILDGVGALNEEGGRGGPEAHASQVLVAGRFDIYDAWQNHENPRKAQIYRGQEVFNNGDQNGKQCAGCHNAANSGNHVNGSLFNVGASDARWAKPNMAVYTITSRVDPTKTLQTTDPGRGGRTGNFADLNKFKVPSLRGLLARAPYFHGGIVDTLPGVVTFYEESLGFDFTPEQEADLAAFMSAL